MLVHQLRFPTAWLAYFGLRERWIDGRVRVGVCSSFFCDGLRARSRRRWMNPPAQEPARAYFLLATLESRSNLQVVKAARVK